jgi:hexulose-6-phosphate isomerase
MSAIAARIGFMQGRFSPLVGGRIQAFPWDHWQDEFPLAARDGFHLVEWTLDQDRLYENPLLTAAGQSRIRALCEQHAIAIPSLTGDCFMQAPFWKAHARERETLERDFQAIARACAAVGIAVIVMPLVDAGQLDDSRQEDQLVAFLQAQSELLATNGLRVAFECDFAPAQLARLMERFDPALFGVNYDIGNSSALGFDPADEIATYGRRIINVHVKDRVLGGTTVPLGTGNADFDTVFAALARVGYAGKYVLQTARAADGDHAGALRRYRDETVEWVRRHAA